MRKRTNTSLPCEYVVCIHADRPLAATFLHKLTYPALLGSQNYLHLIKSNQCLREDNVSTLVT